MKHGFPIDKDTKSFGNGDKLFLCGFTDSEKS
jgi:hypothetical protein